MKKTGAGHDGRSYKRALSILDALKPSKPMAAVVDAALLAVKPFDSLPADSILPALMDGTLRRQELGYRRKTPRSFCMACQMWFGKVCGASSIGSTTASRSALSGTFS